VKGATRLNLPRVDVTNRAAAGAFAPARKMTGAMTKFKSLRENFRSREKKIRADLEKVSKIWGKLGKRFKWWGSLP
jgi:hypothetical protein